MLELEIRTDDNHASYKQVPADEELDRIEEQLDTAHRLINHIGAHTWEDEHRLACREWLRRYPEPEEDEKCSPE